MSENDVPTRCEISQKVELRPAPGRGLGLFAREPIAAGEVVLVWGGPSYTDAAGAERARAEGKGVMQWDEDLYSFDVGELEDAFRLNHSCDPNVWMVGAFTVSARRNIAPGEELGLDYATIVGEREDTGGWKCECGSPKCRGTISGEDYRLEALQREYRGHFSPILNKRIESP